MAKPTVKLVVIGEAGDEVECSEWEFDHITDAVEFFGDSDALMTELHDGEAAIDEEDESDEEDDDEDPAEI